MLLFIALANSHYFLRGSVVLGGYPMDGSGLDSAVIWFTSTFVDGRAFPLFGVLFGYGVALIASRQQALGPRGVRRLLWRRGLALVVIGFLHAVLLYVGDILAAYGVLLFFGAWCVRWKDRWLVVTAVAFFVLTALPGDGSLSSDPPDVAMLPPDVPSMLFRRAPVAAYIASLGPLGFMCPFAIGLWAGRRHILAQPERHRPLLRGTALAGICAAALGAQPVSLLLAGVTNAPQESLELRGSLHQATGVLGGLGYAALLALLSIRLTTRGPGPVVNAIAAAGQRSMTCYLAQSVVWSLAFTPFLLDLSGTLTVATTALLAGATWLATVVLAAWLQRTGRRGPFERLVRRVTYGRRQRALPAGRSSQAPRPSRLAPLRSPGQDGP